MPTLKLRTEELERYAREADAQVCEADREPELEIVVDVGEMPSLPPGEEAFLDEAPPSGRKTLPPPLADSDFRVARTGEVWPELERVPVVVASKEDLSWFELDGQANALLAMIDGESSVGSILDLVTIPRFDALALFHELESHHVIAFR
jgi:hypothetical protein